MGWKSTIDLTRKEAEDILRTELDDLASRSDTDIADAIEALRGGDEHGHNYRIVTEAMKQELESVKTTANNCPKTCSPHDTIDLCISEFKG